LRSIKFFKIYSRIFTEYLKNEKFPFINVRLSIFCLDLSAEKFFNPYFMSYKTTLQPFRLFIPALFLGFSLSGHAQLNGNSPKHPVGNQQIVLLNDNHPTTFLSPKTETPLVRLNGKAELVGKRDLFTKHFNNGDGTITAVIGSGPIHYLKNGLYKDINPGIAINSNPDYPYANTTNLMETYFGATSAKGILSHAIEGNIREFTGAKMYWETNGQPLAVIAGSDVPVAVNGNIATYKNLYYSVDAEFTVLGGARKLNYILKDHSAVASTPASAQYLVFSEDITLNSGWGYIITTRGVQLTDNRGVTVYEYMNPVSHDAGSPGAFENNTIVDVKKNGNVLTILTKVKASWLTSGERVFPVVVDPTSVYYPNNLADASGQCFETGGGSGDIYAGYSGGWYRGWVTFNTTGLPACTILNATVSLYPGAVTGTFGTGSGVFIGQSKYDLSSLTFFPAYDDVYTAITDNPTNTGGAYAEITAATLGSYLNVELGAFGRADIAAKAGGANSFFPISLSPSWGTGTTDRIMGFYGYADATRKPYLSVTYTQSELYCHPTNISANCAAYGDCEYIGIANVLMGTISNPTTYNSTPTGYNSYTAMTTNVIPESNYTLNVTYGDNGAPVNAGNLAAWIDWNNDGSMSAGEFLGNSGSMINNQTFGFNFNVPAGAIAGPKRLRVRSAYTADGLLTAGSACTSLDYGETEDYTVNVVIPPANDNCATTLGLTPGGNFAAHAVTGTNEFATNSSQTSPACANYQGGDVWYSVMVPVSGSLTIETASAGSTLTDTGLAVYSGICGALTLLGCDDNAGTGNFSLVAVSGRPAGEVLYVRTWGFANLISGTFQISAWDASLGIGQHNMAAIGLSPNPAHTELTIQSQETVSSITIYNLLGQMVHAQKASPTINVSGLSNGIYVIQATMENGTIATEKFIKE
jgi:hypothetical protein